MKESFKREIIVYGPDFWDFYNHLNKKDQAKIDQVIGLVRVLRMIPEKFFKHIVDGIFEIRVKVGSNIYRIFCFFDDGHLVILLNAFQKKTNKTPGNEIDRAIQLRQKYYEEKRSK